MILVLNRWDDLVIQIYIFYKYIRIYVGINKVIYQLNYRECLILILLDFCLLNFMYIFHASRCIRHLAGYLKPENLVLRHVLCFFFLCFPPNSRDITCLVVEFNAALNLVPRAKKVNIQYFIWTQPSRLQNLCFEPRQPPPPPSSSTDFMYIFVVIAF